MGDRSAMEWTDATWNPIRARHRTAGGTGHFCVHVSEGCRNCYAGRILDGRGWNGMPATFALRKPEQGE